MAGGNTLTHTEISERLVLHPPHPALLAAIGLFSLIEPFYPSPVNLGDSPLDFDFGLTFARPCEVL
jgi:hypothetical protein